MSTLTFLTFPIVVETNACEKNRRQNLLISRGVFFLCLVLYWIGTYFHCPYFSRCIDFAHLLHFKYVVRVFACSCEFPLTLFVMD